MSVDASKELKRKDRHHGGFKVVPNRAAVVIKHGQRFDGHSNRANNNKEGDEERKAHCLIKQHEMACVPAWSCWDRRGR